MTSHTDSDAELYDLLGFAIAQAVPDLCQKIPGTTFHRVAMDVAAAIRSRTDRKRSILLDLVRVRPTHPINRSPGARSVAPSLSDHAHGTERPTARGI